MIAVGDHVRFLAGSPPLLVVQLLANECVLVEWIDSAYGQHQDVLHAATVERPDEWNGLHS